MRWVPLLLSSGCILHAGEARFERLDRTMLFPCDFGCWDGLAIDQARLQWTYDDGSGPVRWSVTRDERDRLAGIEAQLTESFDLLEPYEGACDGCDADATWMSEVTLGWIEGPRSTYTFADDDAPAALVDLRALVQDVIAEGVEP